MNSRNLLSALAPCGSQSVKKSLSFTPLLFTVVRRAPASEVIPVLPEVAICRQTGDLWGLKNVKNRQFWPFGDFFPIH